MIRKMLVAGAAAILPVTGLAGAAIVATSGVAGAKAPVVAPLTCAIGGAINFAGAPSVAAGTTFNLGGLTEGGTAGKDAKTTSHVVMTSSDAGCADAGNKDVAITEKATKCSVAAWGTGSFAGLSLTPAVSVPPACAAYPKAKYYGTGWGFVDTTASATDAIVLALKKGVNVIDNGVALTLTVSSIATTAPGGACGSNAGFNTIGVVKKTTTPWHLQLCLTTDSGPGTGGTFIGDLGTEVLDTVSGVFNNDLSVQSATIDSDSSSLVIGS